MQLRVQSCNCEFAEFRSMRTSKFLRTWYFMRGGVSCVATSSLAFALRAAALLRTPTLEVFRLRDLMVDARALVAEQATCGLSAGRAA